MTDASRFTCIAVLVFAITAGGCATTRKIETGSTPIDQAQQEVPSDRLLDVGIGTFDPGIPEEEDEMIFPELRRAEARYIPFHLKRTLQRSGHWGAIWMVPIDAKSTDLMVDGEILDSDGERLELAITIVDSSGQVWLQRKYRGEADLTSYDHEDGIQRDPFQDVYNQIANDMLEARRLRSTQELAELRQISQLRFAADLAPDAFGNHLTVDADGRTHIRRLPSQEDPMLMRVEMLRERDYLLMDTLNEHYAEFYTSMGDAYDQFREFNYEEVIALRQLKRDANIRLALGTIALLGGMALAIVDGGATATLLAPPLLAGGYLGVQSGWQLRSESMLHAIAIQELGRSFESDVAPRVVEVQGRTLKLTGSAETQYRNWRRLLREIYESETGLSSENSDGLHWSSGPPETGAAAETLTP